MKLSVRDSPDEMAGISHLQIFWHILVILPSCRELALWCEFLSVQSSAVGTVVSSRWVALTFKIVKAVWTQYSPLPKHSPEASREEASLQPERILIPAVRGCEDIFPGGKKERVVGDRAIWTFYTLKKFWCIFSVVLRKHEIRYSVQFSRSVVSDFLWPHGLQHTGFPVHHQFPEFTQTHVHHVGDAIQPFHPLLSPSSPAFNLSQNRGLFQSVSSLHQVAKVLEFQLQHQSFQWIFRTDFL